MTSSRGMNVKVGLPTIWPSRSKSTSCDDIQAEGSFLKASATVKFDGNIIGCSENFLKVCKWRNGEERGKNIVSLIRFSNPDEVQQAILEIGSLTIYSQPWIAPFDSRDGDFEIEISVKDSFSDVPEPSIFSLSLLSSRGKKKYLEAVIRRKRQPPTPDTTIRLIESKPVIDDGTDRRCEVPNILTILVVDDSIPTLKIMKRLLEREGHIVDTEEDGSGKSISSFIPSSSL